MTRHLHEEEICRRLAGEADDAADRHLASCAECRQEVVRQRELLAGFRNSTREGSSRRMAAYDGVWARGLRGLLESSGGGRSGSGRIWVAGLATACVAICAVVVLWLPRHESATSQIAKSTTAQVSSAHMPAMDSSGADDAALLRRVGVDLSRTAPGPMEPLSNLIEWQPETGGQ